MNNGEEPIRVTLSGVLYVPEICGNLLSATKIANIGHEMHLNAERFIISTLTGETIAIATRWKSACIIKELEDENKPSTVYASSKEQDYVAVAQTPCTP